MDLYILFVLINRVGHHLVNISDK